MILATFESEVDELLGTVSEARTAFNAKKVGVSLRDNVVEFALVEATNLFEQYVETLFGESLLGTVSSAQPTLRANNEAEVSLILHQSANPEAYLTWMPFKETTLQRAHRLLVNGIPFAWTARRSQDIALLADLTVLRNYAAHRSGQARKKFLDLCARRQYGTLLRAADFALQEEQGALQIESLLTRLKLIAAALRANDDVAAIAILGSEDPYASGKEAPPGSYECLKCRSGQKILDYAVIGACRNCGTGSPCSSCGKPVATKSFWARTHSD